MGCSVESRHESPRAVKASNWVIQNVAEGGIAGSGKSNRSRPLPTEAACEVRELTSPKRVPPEAIKSVVPLPR